MKAALDTNALVDICKDNAWTSKLVAYLDSNPTSELILLAHVGQEFDSSKLSAEELNNFRRIEKAGTNDDHHYFTIGQSMIGGPDTIRGDSNDTTGIQRETIDINDAYSNYVATQQSNGRSVKSIEKWNLRNNHQSDAVIYERADELGCDFLVTSDGDLLTKVGNSSGCKAIKTVDFIASL